MNIKFLRIEPGKYEAIRLLVSRPGDAVGGVASSAQHIVPATGGRSTVVVGCRRYHGEQCAVCDALGLRQLKRWFVRVAVWRGSSRAWTPMLWAMSSHQWASVAAALPTLQGKTLAAVRPPSGIMGFPGPCALTPISFRMPCELSRAQHDALDLAMLAAEQCPSADVLEDAILPAREIRWENRDGDPLASLLQRDGLWCAHTVEGVQHGVDWNALRRSVHKALSSTVGHVPFVGHTVGTHEVITVSVGG